MTGVGGAGDLAQVTGSGAGVSGARDVARHSDDLALWRERVDVGRTRVEGALDTSESVDPQAQIEEAETALYRVAGGEAEMGSVKSFNAASLTALQAAERALNSGGHLSGITTGIGSMNAKIGGMHNSDLMILAG